MKVRWFSLFIVDQWIVRYTFEILSFIEQNSNVFEEQQLTLILSSLNVHAPRFIFSLSSLYALSIVLSSEKTSISIVRKLLDIISDNYNSLFNRIYNPNSILLSIAQSALMCILKCILGTHFGYLLDFFTLAAPAGRTYYRRKKDPTSLILNYEETFERKSCEIKCPTETAKAIDFLLGNSDIIEYSCCSFFDLVNLNYQY